MTKAGWGIERTLAGLCVGGGAWLILHFDEMGLVMAWIGIICFFVGLWVIVESLKDEFKTWRERR